jgi:predicted transglutaminase-like cysteine proteinase
MTTYAQAQAVQAAINKMPYRSDAARYQRDEFWKEIDAKGGDCEDFALAKRAALLAQGVDPDTLHLALCWTERDEFHAVLVVDTEQGSYVLDNRHEQPMARQDLGYRWHSIQEGSTWHALA